MIHFTCDGCDRRIDTTHETRYVLRLEVYAAPESSCQEEGQYGPGFEDDSLDADPASLDSDRDHLAEIDDLLERVDDFVAPEGENPLTDDYRQVRYDLCSDCRKRMLSNPLGRLAASKIEFSDN